MARTEKYPKIYSSTLLWYCYSYVRDHCAFLPAPRPDFMASATSGSCARGMGAEVNACICPLQLLPIDISSEVFPTCLSVICGTVPSTLGSCLCSNSSLAGWLKRLPCERCCCCCWCIPDAASVPDNERCFCVLVSLKMRAIADAS